jgi:hypothetical protein
MMPVTTTFSGVMDRDGIQSLCRFKNERRKERKVVAMCIDGESALDRQRSRKIYLP